VLLYGASGSGKTYSALKLAQGLGIACDKICLIDTERSGDMYASEDCSYNVIDLNNYSVESYTEAIKAALAAGQEAIIIDSLSHLWEGTGGLLELNQKYAKDKHNGNTFNAWADVKKVMGKFYDLVFRSQTAHFFVTLRTKTDYAMEVNERGKTAPRKIGLAPIFKDGIEYEFDLSFSISESHAATCVKDRTQLFANQDLPEPITEATGAKILEWANSGKPNELAELLEQARTSINAAHSAGTIGDAEHNKYLDVLPTLNAERLRAAIEKFS
jgi:hypothetical protein